MTSQIPATAMQLAQTVFETTHDRRFRGAVREFVRLLRSVPDYPPVEISGGTIQLVQHLAERIVQQIEQRLASGENRQSFRQDLAQAVYDIRDALEEIDHWHRHYYSRR